MDDFEDDGASFSERRRRQLMAAGWKPPKRRWRDLSRFDQYALVAVSVIGGLIIALVVTYSLHEMFGTPFFDSK